MSHAHWSTVASPESTAQGSRRNITVLGGRCAAFGDTGVEGAMPNNLPGGKGPGPVPRLPTEAPESVEDVPQPPKGSVEPKSPK